MKFMQNKIFLLVAIFSLFIIFSTISTISASEVTITNDTSSGIKTAQTIYDTIYLEPGVYSGVNNTNIIINTKNVTIIGKTSTKDVFIDAESSSRIFQIDPNFSLTLINVTLINGGGIGNGSHIYNNGGSLTIINSTLSNGNAWDGGGSIYVKSSGNLSIIGSKFVNNYAYIGGSIYALDFGFLNISDCIFKNNSIGEWGDGGAIFAQNGLDINISDSNFSNNSAYRGGALFSNNVNLSIINHTNFNNNSVHTLYGEGGGIFIESSNVFIDNSIFSNNNASNNGGAIYVNWGVNLNLSNSNFTYNWAKYGGGIFLNIPSPNITICKFSNNHAEDGGGGIYVNNGGIYLSDSFFDKNTASNNGGAIFINENAKSNINKTNFTNNTASYGGGIFINNKGYLTIVDSVLSDNIADINGGAVFLNPNSTAKIENIKLLNNKAGDGGAIFINEDGILNLNNSYFNSNSANRGGAIYNNGQDSNVTNSNFINNKATNQGGSIYNQANMIVSGNSMSGNSAGLGQMIYNAGNMGILNLTYLSNKTINTKKGATVVIYVTLTDDMGNTITGEDIFFYANDIYLNKVTSIEGYASFSYDVNVNPVSYILITGNYSGHEGYSIVIKDGILFVDKESTINHISIPPKINVGDTITIENKLTDKEGNPLANKIIDFYINGKYIGSNETDKNGIAKITYTFNNSGTYIITTKYNGNELYYESNASVNVSVKEKTNSSNATDKTKKQNNNLNTHVAMKNTGNPIMMVLLVLLSSLGLMARKKL